MKSFELCRIGPDSAKALPSPLCPGMPPSQIDRVFDAWERSTDQATRATHQRQTTTAPVQKQRGIPMRRPAARLRQMAQFLQEVHFQHSSSSSHDNSPASQAAPRALPESCEGARGRGVGCVWGVAPGVLS